MAKPQELAIGLVVPENEMATGSPSPSKTRPTEMKYQHARLLISGKTPSDLLADHIRDQATVMPNNILKVNSFLNHQVDCHLMHVCGHELARRFRGLNVTKVFTGFGSGLMCAQSCAMQMRVPLVFATDPAPLARDGVAIFSASIGTSSTGRNLTRMHVSSEFLGPADRVLIIDDMLSKGGTVACLAELASQAGAKVVAAGFLIEKEYEGGRAVVSKTLGLSAQRVQSIVTVTSLVNGIEMKAD